jgi:hypothetical protein
LISHLHLKSRRTQVPCSLSIRSISFFSDDPPLPEVIHDENMMLRPCRSPGVKAPVPEVKGAVTGFGDVHRRAHLCRAAGEGPAYAHRKAKERQEKRGGRKRNRR